MQSGCFNKLKKPKQNITKGKQRPQEDYGLFQFYSQNTEDDKKVIAK